MKLNVPALLALVMAVILGALMTLAGLEAYLLAAHQAPISSYVYCATAAFPLPTLLIAAVFSWAVGALFAHFWWPLRRG